MDDRHRFLANENFPKRTVEWLRSEGHDVIHAADYLHGQGLSDEHQLDTARREDRILLTFDRDFGEMIFHQRQRPPRGIVLFRLQQQSPERINQILRTFFMSNPDLFGFFTVVSSGHVRQTPLNR